MTLRITILGCGSSTGTPRVGNDWGACDPGNPKNRRRRSSLLVEKIGPDGRTVVVIDTSPDLREQFLQAGVTRLDARSTLMTMPTIRMGSTISGRFTIAAPPHRCVGRSAHARSAPQTLRLLLRDACRDRTTPRLCKDT